MRLGIFLLRPGVVSMRSGFVSGARRWQTLFVVVVVVVVGGGFQPFPIFLTIHLFETF